MYNSVPVDNALSVLFFLLKISCGACVAAVLHALQMSRWW